MCQVCYEAAVKEEDAADRAERIARIKTLIPDRFRNASVDDFANQPHVHQLCSDWIAAPSDGLFIFGPVGPGKTHLASGVTIGLIMDGVYVEFINFTDALEQMRRDYKKQNFDIRDDNLNHYQICKVLCLDDLGSEKTSEWVEEKIFSIVNFRYDRRKPTIFTSNLSLGEIENHYSDRRVSSRIAEMCRGRIIKLEGKDRRLG